MSIEFLKIVLGNRYFSSKDYEANIIFQGVNLCSEKDILTICSKKKDNSVMFLLIKKLKKYSIISYKNMVCSKTKTKKMIVILNIIANLLQMILVYQK